MRFSHAFRPPAQIDLEEYDESGDARKRWKDAIDAAGTTMGG